MEIETREKQIKGRLQEINTELRALPDPTTRQFLDLVPMALLDNYEKEVDGLIAELKPLEEARKAEQAEQADRAKLANKQAERRAMLDGIASGTVAAVTIEKYPGDRSERKMEYNDQNKDIEIRAFQKYILGHQMEDTEKRALDIAGAAAVLPQAIMNNLITSEKYSDLLYRATVIREPNVGTMLIPVASNTASTWHVENAPGAEAAPTLTSIALGGYELLRLMQVSAATMNRSTPEFQEMMLNLLSSENIETLEASFVTGVGNTMPLGLDAMTWNVTNQILTANAATPISPDDVAQGIGLLPQKYARNAVLLMNAKSLYNIASYSDANGDYIFAATEATSRFMSKEIIVDEHVLDNVIYVVDPKQLYVRFSMPLTVQADQSAGFTTASIYLRALCIVDAKWNPAACVRIGLGA